MKFLILLYQIAILTGFYLVGVWIQKFLSLSVPGSMIGMLLLFLALNFKIIPVRFVDAGSTFLIKHLPLLFLPVTVGILLYLDLFAGKGILLIFISLISTIMVMVVTGYIGEKLVKRKEEQNKQ
ncbi:CidA/LrgA family protein [Halalkalibacter akibai]|uniref:Holin-like protein CidA n=1 Tax=Halalkalibacter akibai (strain ATCC 43226 / DSM 21942 / CIP 109018 / JCM 9157 / 1139) TaxID=1236973 RepID=W4QQ46_HALA3|nr:CidA/LrgA family holin-like protein [Halalkalibacter akibai]GAE34201.1 holin-like protein CidA [Halalkalibacter akibai JCM 9157]